MLTVLLSELPANHLLQFHREDQAAGAKSAATRFQREFANNYIMFHKFLTFNAVGYPANARATSGG